jgi:hypothetical protein
MAVCNVVNVGQTGQAILQSGYLCPENYVPLCLTPCFCVYHATLT